MGYALRPGVSFCEVDRSAIFLDLVADRYFCLGKPASAAFLEFVRCPLTEIAPDWPAYGLVDQGVLLPIPGSTTLNACTGSPVSGTMFDRRSGSAISLGVAEALCLRGAAEVALKVCGLDKCMSAAAQRRQCSVRIANRDLALCASKAFAGSALWRSRQQRCLSISFATVEWLLRRGCRVELILGVRLHPFQAHCWTQCDGILINDTVDAVRNFTPILIV